MFGFSASNPLWCLQANIIEIFFLIVEEEDFLYFPFILEVEALSMSSRSLFNLQMHPVGLRLDHVVALKCIDQLGRLNENRYINVYLDIIFCEFIFFFMTDV